MTLEIKEGRYYLNSGGEKIGPMAHNMMVSTRYKYPFRSPDNCTFMKDGTYEEGRASYRDLVAEWAAPAEDDEWGEWMPVDEAFYAWKDDYIYRRIGETLEYRTRKPRRVTMLVDVIDGTPDLSTLREVEK